MDIKYFISGKYIKQIEYSSFLPEKVSKEWIISSPKINLLLSEANRLLVDFEKLNIIQEYTGFKRNRKFIFKEYFDIFNKNDN